MQTNEKRKRGRPPIFGVAMTAQERYARWEARTYPKRKAAARAAGVQELEPGVTVLTDVQKLEAVLSLDSELAQIEDLRLRAEFMAQAATNEATAEEEGMDEEE
jgi:hypothetical protein